MIRQIAALVFIFICTTIAWMILGATITSRTNSTNEQLQGRVASTWGTPQEQSPPTAAYTVTELRNVPRWEDGKSVVRTEKIENQIPVKLNASRIQVDFHLDPRQKGLLWYSTYQVQFAGDYTFQNDSSAAQTLCFRFKFPAQKAVYDGLAMLVNGNKISPTTDDQGVNGQAVVGPGETAVFHIAYRSQGLNTCATNSATASRKRTTSPSTCEPISKTSTSPTILCRRPRSSGPKRVGIWPGNTQT